MANYCYRNRLGLCWRISCWGEICYRCFGREATLTGRTEIWAKFLPFALKEPLIGHGVGGFWTDAMQKSLEYHLTQAHNGYLDIFLDYGFVGSAAFLVVFVVLVSEGA